MKNEHNLNPSWWQCKHPNQKNEKLGGDTLSSDHYNREAKHGTRCQSRPREGSQELRREGFALSAPAVSGIFQHALP